MQTTHLSKLSVLIARGGLAAAVAIAALGSTARVTNAQVAYTELAAAQPQPGPSVTPPVMERPAAPAPTSSQGLISPQPVLHNVKAANERLNMIANTSRILVLQQKIPQVQVNNPDIVEVQPLSPTQLQVYAKKAGVTQINLWNENKEIFTIEVVVDADAQELTAKLRELFPNSALEVIALPNSVMLKGYVDDPGSVSQIIAIAQQYHPQVLDMIRVGGVQQVLLKVKVMEVSRSKLRTLGIDFSELTTGSGSFVGSGTTGLLRGNSLLPTNQVLTDAITGNPIGVAAVPGAAAATGAQNFSFGIINSSQAFIGFLEALRQDDLAKILAEPEIVTNSGRPAFFNSGGEFPILVPQSLGTVSIQYKPYGTQVDFVPIVLGNGWIRLEVKPRISEIDPTRSVIINNVNVPALKVREVDTGVEMQPGQTLAIAGLVQNRVEAQKRGLPFISDLPYVGPLFSRIHDQTNEIELLIFVTPELNEAMDPQQVPYCGPGMDTTTGTDAQFYAKGTFEVPKVCPPEAYPLDSPPPVDANGAPVTAEQVMPGQPEPTRTPVTPDPASSAPPSPPSPREQPPVVPRQTTTPRLSAPTGPTMTQSAPRSAPSAARPAPTSKAAPATVSRPTQPPTVATPNAPRYSVQPNQPARQPVLTANRPVDTRVEIDRSRRPATAPNPANSNPQSLPGLFGSVGYDELK